MHIACEYGHPETALAFLKKGVPLHMPNKSGDKCETLFCFLSIVLLRNIATNL